VKKDCHISDSLAAAAQPSCCGGSRRFWTPWRVGGLLLAVGLLLYLAGCGARVHMPLATQPDVDRALSSELVNSEFTLSDLERGRALYMSRCTACHAPVDVHSYSPEEWVVKVAEMIEESRVSDQDAKLIETYIVIMASGPRVK
jgi:hypothetical protein